MRYRKHRLLLLLGVLIVSLAACGNSSDSTEVEEAISDTSQVASELVEDAAGEMSELEAQGKLCIAEIGVIEPFSCLTGEAVPVSLNGKVWESGDPFSAVCDMPSWLGGNNPSWCHPNARIGRLASLDAQGNPDDDVQNVFVCRHYSNAEATDPCFEDVAIIQHRKSTGATCFFQHEPPAAPSNDFGCSPGTGPAPANKEYQRINAERVPPPSETAEQTYEVCEDCPTAEEFWLTPTQTAKVGCNHCHANGPFIHSPYISQVTVTDENGKVEPIVYPTEPNNLYRFVGDAFTEKNGWDKPHYLGNLNACTSCHVMGTGVFNFRLVSFAVGHLQAPPADTMPHYCSVFYTPVSDYGASYPHSHWMPPGGSSGTTREEWNSLYDESVKELLACMPTSITRGGEVIDFSKCLPEGVMAGHNSANCKVTPYRSAPMALQDK